MGELSDLMVAGIFGAGITLFASIWFKDYLTHSYPKTDVVQSGYVVPSRLEVNLVDLDGDGELETTLKYDGRRYLLLQSEQGEVSLKMYETK